MCICAGINRHDVAAMMVKVDKSGDGYLDYKEFIKSLVSHGRGHGGGPHQVQVPNC